MIKATKKPPARPAGGFFVLTFCTLSRRQIRRDSIQYVRCTVMAYAYND